MATMGTLGEKQKAQTVFGRCFQLDHPGKTAMFQTPTSIIGFTTTKANVTIMQMLGLLG